MNVADSEIIASILEGSGFVGTDDIDTADLILINTCSIRDNAERRVFARLKELARLRKRNAGLMIGIIGCMAERLKEKRKQLYFKTISVLFCGADGTRTRDPRRDRPVF